MNKKLLLNFKKFKKRVFNNKKNLSLGTWLQLPSYEVAGILSSSGYEWVAVDLEHGSFSPSILPRLFKIISSEGAFPFSRLKSSKKYHIQESLDAGALGIIIPNIESSYQLEEVIKFATYPPEGQRGVGFSSSNDFGKNFETYKKYFSSPIIIAMIESEKGIDELEEIVKLRGLNGILIGPYDLSASLKITGKFDHPKFKARVNQIIKICKKNKITIGCHNVNQNKQSLITLIKKGFTFIPYGIDSIFLQNTHPFKKKY